MLDMALEQQTGLKSGIVSHFKGKTTKEWNEREYETNIKEMKAKLAAMEA